MTEETQALVDRLEERAKKHRHEVAECSEAPLTAETLPVTVEDDEEPLPCKWCATRAVDAQVMAEAAAALTTLARDLETARQERDAALADVAEMEALFCGIKEIHAVPGVPGRASAIVDGEGVKWFARLVSQFFYQAGGKNYVEWQCSVDVAEFVLTCQRKSGKTPDQLRREAEASRDAAVRAARAETWDEAAALAYAHRNHGLSKECRERASAAREGQ